MKTLLTLFVILVLGTLTSDPKLSYAGDLTPLDLTPGDVIFSLNTVGGADHVGIFAGIGKDGRPYVLHSVSDKKYRALVKTTLKPFLAETYVVARNNNLDLGIAALQRMKRWAEVLVPYDFAAADMAYCIEDSNAFSGSAAERLEQHYQYALNEGVPRFYRRIKYAARRELPTLPEHPRIGSSGRGFRCDEAVTLAFQVEEITPYVRSIGNPEHLGAEFTEWVSDEYLFDEILDSYHPSAEYLAYRQQLLSPDEYKVSQAKKFVHPEHLKFLPSISAWNYSRNPSIEDFAKSFDTCLPMDSKISTVSVLWTHVQRDKKHWTVLGELTVQEIPFSPEEKETWRSQLLKTLDELKKSKQTAGERIVASSPSLRGLSPFSPARGSSMDSEQFSAELGRPLQVSPFELDSRRSPVRFVRSRSGTSQ